MVKERREIKLHYQGDGKLAIRERKDQVGMEKKEIKIKQL